jgi:hypothetical protein
METGGDQPLIGHQASATIRGAIAQRFAGLANSVSASQRIAGAILWTVERSLFRLADPVTAYFVDAVKRTTRATFTNLAHAVATGNVTVAILRTDGHALAGFADSIAASRVGIVVAVWKTVGDGLPVVADTISARQIEAFAVRKAVGGGLSGFALAIAALLPVCRAIARTAFQRLTDAAEVVAANFADARFPRNAAAYENQQPGGKRSSLHEVSFQVAHFAAVEL